VAVATCFQEATNPAEALEIVWPGLPVGMGLQAVASIGVMCFVSRKLAHRPVLELSTPGALSEFSAGALIGAAIIGLSVLVLTVLGVYSVTDVGWGRGILVGLLVGLGAAFGEEVVMRGILLRLLIGWFGTPVSILATSVLFGLVHLGTPSATPISVVGVAIQAGVLFGAAYVLTRRLWLAVGIHAAWNFVQSGVFGFNISGISLGAGLFTSELEGPPWLTGGESGIEGSAVLLIVSGAVAAGLSVIAYARSRGERENRAVQEG
jgi:membrane protease YdiL (CAAX protease family)